MGGGNSNFFETLPLVCVTSYGGSKLEGVGEGPKYADLGHLEYLKFYVKN